MDKQEKATRHAKDAAILCLLATYNLSKDDTLYALERLDAMPYQELIKKYQKTLATSNWRHSLLARQTQWLIEKAEQSRRAS